jgi:hypothetical protein
MTFNPTPRTVASHPSLFLGDDAHIEASHDFPDQQWPVDVTISAKGDPRTVGTLHLSPAATRELCDALTAVLCEIKSALAEVPA